jgi:hypothetical protein
LKEQTSKNAPTIRTGKDYTVSGEELWNRSYVHELGNKLNRDVLAKGGEHHGGPTTSKSGYPDTDAGGRLEECLFGNIRP